MTLTAPHSLRPRLDRLLVERGLVATHEKARALILAGRVTSSGAKLDKPGVRIDADLPLEISEGTRWASRGGEKLDGALDRLSLTISGRDALDVGASTGGFTDVLLQRGVRRVIALDVGRGQLDWRLRNDPRVRVIEGSNARHLTPAALPWIPEIAVIDVSFISLRSILPAVAACLDPDGDIVALVKPQFEVRRGAVGRGGIVRAIEDHRRVLSEIVRFSRASGWCPRSLCAASITGASGNQEYFIHVRMIGEVADESTISTVIDRAIEEGRRP